MASMKVNLGWTIASTILAIGAYPLAFYVLPNYVRQKAEHYADSFFGALITLDKEENS